MHNYASSSLNGSYLKYQRFFQFKYSACSELTILRGGNHEMEHNLLLAGFSGMSEKRFSFFKLFLSKSNFFLPGAYGLSLI